LLDVLVLEADQRLAAHAELAAAAIGLDDLVPGDPSSSDIGTQRVVREFTNTVLLED
jgi:hypothetical protein